MKKNPKFHVSAGVAGAPKAPKKHPGQHPGKPKGKGGDGFWKQWNPLSMQTGKQGKRYLNAAENLEFNPLDRQLQSEQMASQFRQNQQIPAWYQDYQNTLSRIRGETQAAYGQATSAVQQQSAQAGQQDAANRGDAMDRLQKDAQLRGTSVDPNVNLGQVNAEAARANSQTAALGTIAGQGANRYAYLSGLQGVASQQGIEARQEEGARGRKISADQRELGKQRGDFRYKVLQDLIESERKYALERKATKLDARGLAEDIRHDKAGEATASGNLAARLRSIRDDEASDKITHAQAQQRIKQAKRNARETARHHHATEKADKKGKKKGKL